MVPKLRQQGWLEATKKFQANLIDINDTIYERARHFKKTL